MWKLIVLLFFSVLSSQGFANEAVLGPVLDEKMPITNEVREFDTPFDACVDWVDQFPVYSIENADKIECDDVQDDVVFCLVDAWVNSTNFRDCEALTP